MPEVRLEGLRKTYGKVVAVGGVDLVIAGQGIRNHPRPLGLR